MFDVITIGSATVDVFAYTSKAHLERHRHKDLITYPADTKILLEELYLTTGGGATNTAASFARLGLKTGWVSVLGKDAHGAFIREEMRKEKAAFLGYSSPVPTNYSLILDSKEHKRTILAFKAASEELRFSMLNKQLLKASWFYLCTLTGKSYPVLEQCAIHAKKMKAQTACNPSTYLASKGLGYLRKLLSLIDVLVLNKEEAALILSRQQSHQGSTKSLLDSLQQAGPRIVVVTDGKKGAYCKAENFFFKILPHKVKVVETTGAGDAFTSSFVAGLILSKKKELKERIEFALKLGQVNAESVITHHGAKNKLLAFTEAASLLQKKKYVVKCTE